MVRVLVLGATGYIGIATCLTLHRHSHIVYGLARSASKAKDLAANEIIPVMGTVEDGDYLQTISSANIDVVVDCAGANDGSWKVLEDLKKIGADRLARRRGAGPKLGFVYTSGTWVHGKTSDRLNDLNPAGMEGDLGCPVQPPALVAWRPKLENAILEARSVLDVAVMRPACVYGRASTIWTLWFDPIYQAVKENNSTVSLQCDADAIVSLVHIDDVASALVAATEQISTVSAYPVFDIVTSRESLGLILRAVARSMGYGKELEFVEPTDAFPKAMSTGARLDSTRLRDLFGWHSKRIFGMLDEIEIVTAAWKAAAGKE